ncbi:hypothetical protein GYMLUDRAFT_243769 [Collybiopsis luxurians FD-317 M1]|uniref:Uncharacterized protein n=1 Tax=Collybiopsis luxurians FD-317 M1 TaxID=944289 RepID=A0A0D0CEU2_9AGAR|nr:hypothetical protein GYMLUDRAFT_243769 [Collybiopsis luxurians FD-317 M1]
MEVGTCLHLKLFHLTDLLSRAIGPFYEEFVPLAASSHLTNLWIDSVEFLECLSSQNVVPPLQRLDFVFSDGLQRLFEHLSCFSTLIQLRLDFVEWLNVPEAQNVVGLSRAQAPFRTKVDFAFPLSKLPSIKHLECPPQLAYLFAGPHCLEEISFCSMLADEGDLLSDNSMNLSMGMRLFFDSPNVNLRRLVDLPGGLMGGQPGESWHGRMQHWFPRLEYIGFVLVLIAPVEYDGEEINFDELDFGDYREQFEEYLMCFTHTWGPLNTVTEISIAVLDEMANDISIDQEWFKDFAAFCLELKSSFPNLSRMMFGNVEYPVDD